MTPTLGYLLALLAITFVIDFTLRALPFKILEPLRDSRFVSDMAVWMPPGVVHLLSGRKLLWSVGIGTVCYVALLNWL